MAKSYLLAQTGDIIFALPADNVEAVVAAARIVPVPLAAQHVAGLAAMRSKVITVIDCGVAVGESPLSSDADAALIVFNLEGHSYGLAVDDVHDVIDYDGEPQRLGAPFTEGWRRVALGVIEVEGKSMVAIDPLSLVVPVDEAA